MITILENPLGEKYQAFKSTVLSSDFPVYANTLGIGDASGREDTYYSHTFIRRPEDLGYTTAHSGQTCMAMGMIDEILSHNNIEYHMIYRLNLNLNHHYQRFWYQWHIDHEFPHTNLVIYLNEFEEGMIEVKGSDPYKPKENDVVMFDGLEHRWGPTPVGQMRAAVVCTFMRKS